MGRAIGSCVNRAGNLAKTHLFLDKVGFPRASREKASPPTRKASKSAQADPRFLRCLAFAAFPALFCSVRSSCRHRWQGSDLNTASGRVDFAMGPFSLSSLIGNERSCWVWYLRAPSPDRGGEDFVDGNIFPEAEARVKRRAKRPADLITY